MQAIYYPTNSLQIKNEDEELTLKSNHDEYSFWFDICSKNVENSAPKLEMPPSTPGIHLAVSRSRLGQINDLEHITTLIKAIKKVPFCEDKQKKAFVLSEQTILPIILAKLFKGKVVCYELNSHMRQVLKAIVKVNDLGNLEIRDDVKCYDDVIVDHDVDLVIGEPNFGISHLPWDNLFFWYKLKNASEKMTILPKKATIWAVPVIFEDLWKIRSPLHSGQLYCSIFLKTYFGIFLS
jgi:protein arginine N-methyltransferase 7